MTTQAIVLHRRAANANLLFAVAIAGTPGLQGDSITVRPKSPGFASKATIAAPDVIANALVDTWSDPELVISTYGLGSTRTAAIQLAKEVFGEGVTFQTGIEIDMDSGKPCLTFDFGIPYALRQARYEFESRYVRKVQIPDGVPVPVILWSYLDAAVPA